MIAMAASSSSRPMASAFARRKWLGHAQAVGRGRRAMSAMPEESKPVKQGDAARESLKEHYAQV